MEDYIKIIDKIESLNLKDYPHDIVKNYLKQLKKFAIVEKTLHKGKKIIRARINNSGERFDNVSDLSYKPKECNTTYQRASTRNNTMFYGAVTPPKIEPGENFRERFTVVGELAYSSNFLKDDESKGKIKITFSRWEVTEDIRLIEINPHKSLLKQYAHSKYLKKQIFKFLKNSNLTEPEKERYIKISKFLSKEFSKEDITGDYDYLVSAVFSELICENGYDGVYYPSVRMEGDGINVAIKPTSVESKMVFKGASKHTFSKYKKDITEQPKYYYRSKLLENGRLQYNKVERLPTVYVKQTGCKLSFNDPHTPQIYNGLFFTNPLIPEVHKKAVESFLKMRLKGYTELKEYCLTIEKCEGSLWVEGERMD